jgi:nitrogen regulatory protein PII
MAQLVALVLDKIELLRAVLDAWQRAGAGGVTLLHSTGPGRLRAAFRDDLPLMPSIHDVLSAHELHHRTIFTVVEDEATAKRIVAATKEVVGDFTEPGTGILFVLPLAHVEGLHKKGRVAGSGGQG